MNCQGCSYYLEVTPLPPKIRSVLRVGEDLVVGVRTDEAQDRVFGYFLNCIIGSARIREEMRGWRAEYTAFWWIVLFCGLANAVW